MYLKKKLANNIIIKSMYTLYLNISTYFLFSAEYQKTKNGPCDKGIDYWTELVDRKSIKENTVYRHIATMATRYIGVVVAKGKQILQVIISKLRFGKAFGNETFKMHQFKRLRLNTNTIYCNRFSNRRKRSRKVWPCPISVVYK